MAINSLQAREVSDQMKILQPTMLDLTEGAILRDVGNLTGTVKMPKRILNMLGEINAYSVFANNPGRIKKLQSVARLAATIALLQRRKTAIAAAKVETADEELRGKGPAGLVTHWSSFRRTTPRTLRSPSCRSTKCGALC